ncbi:MAG: recombinase family protein [Candidatus Poseidonia sp.]|nr:recombinase family protein [Poseidonia sp.]
MNFKQVLKGREPVIAARVSTREQSNTLKAQVAACKAWLIEQGITRSPKVFTGTGSGTEPNPPVIVEAVDYCVKKPGKRVLIVRDYQRLSRNWRYGARLMIPLYENDIPVVSVLKNSMSSTIITPADDDWLIAVFMGIGAQEVDQLKKRTLAGMAASREGGIIAGTTLDFYLDDALNPYRELQRLLRAGVGQSEGSRRLSKSSSWFRKRRDFFRDVLERGGEEAVENWLMTTDMMRERLATLNLKNKEDKKKERALKRMTSGFLKFPYEFPMPTEDDLDEYMNNFQAYQPKRNK